MKRFLLILGIFFIVVACSKAIDKPKNLLSEEKMVEVMSEIFLYQQTSYLSEINNPDLNFSTLDALILKKHEVSPEDFKNSYNYYVMVPEKYKDILKEIRTQMEAQLPLEERKQREIDRKNAGKEKN